MDYLDEMIEARNEEFKLWTSEFIINEDLWRIYRDGALVATETRLEVAEKGISSRFNKLRNRAAMDAAFGVAARRLSPGDSNVKTPSSIDPDCLNGKNTMVVGDPAPLACWQPSTKPKIDWLALNRQTSGR